MQLFKTVTALKTYLGTQRQKSKTIGFVPTMGALHQGHLSLIKQSKTDNDITVCSIFVNPTQFNESSDLDKYPRTPERDQNMLKSLQTDVLFMPSVEEVYPPEQKNQVSYDFGDLETVMEGQFRPGHFKGVAQVVKRLLDIVEPHCLYMGQKDFQQFAIIQNMLEQLNSPIKIIRCPIIREADGLAMSSRNVRLSTVHRKQAVLLHETLKMSKSMMSLYSPEEIKKQAMEKLKTGNFKPEYFEIVDAKTLANIANFNKAKNVVACTAVWAGDVRLIDNMILK